MHIWLILAMVVFQWFAVALPVLVSQTTECRHILTVLWMLEAIGQD